VPRRSRALITFVNRTEPGKHRLIIRPFHIVSVTLASVAFALAGCFQDATPDRSEQVVRSEPPPDHVETGNSNPTDEVSGSAEITNAVAQSKLTEADRARSSWENPFFPRLWSCEGWRIDENSMTCEADAEQAATFLRPYRNAVIECRISTASDSASERNQTPVAMEVRLLNQGTRQWMSVSLSKESVTVAETTEDDSSNLRPLRSAARDAGNDPSEADIRLTITPNRLLVAVDGQMKINAARPASIMHAECLPQFIVREAGVTLSDLRLEGD
jgi:hypothetical protein